MNIYRLQIRVYVSLVTLLSACNLSVKPAFETQQRYKHELYSPDECARLKQISPILNCWEMVEFNPDGTADLLLGGGDIVVRGNYQRKGQKITIQQPVNLPEVVFKIVSDDELVRVGSNTRWSKY